MKPYTDKEFLIALADAVALADKLAAENEADPRSPVIWSYAIEAIYPFIDLAPTPLFIPLQQGGLAVEWHDRGLNIELRFRAVADPFVLLEDAFGQIPQFRGIDLSMSHAQEALRLLATREVS